MRRWVIDMITGGDWVKEHVDGTKTFGWTFYLTKAIKLILHQLFLLFSLHPAPPAPPPHTASAVLLALVSLMMINLTHTNRERHHLSDSIVLCVLSAQIHWTSHGFLTFSTGFSFSLVAPHLQNDLLVNCELGDDVSQQ